MWWIKFLALWGAIATASIPWGPARPARQHLTIMGATSVLPYIKVEVARWQAHHPQYSVAVSGGGSIAGLMELGQGHVSIAVSDLPPKPQWVDYVQKYPLGSLPILFVANRQAGVQSIDRRQLSAVFSGTITKWDQVGGARRPIIVVTRPLASGARAVVESQLLRGRSFTRQALVQLSNGAVVRTVLDTPGAIGFVEGGRALSGLLLLTVGKAQPATSTRASWPYMAHPALYVRPNAPSVVKRLANYLATRPQRRQYGIVP